MLICPVRDCRLPLDRKEGRFVCAREHSFDIARSGYINLLQPQDRRSKEPGDARNAVNARRRLHDLGVTAPLLRGLAELAGLAPDDIVLDAGCGDGFYLGNLARQTGCQACGVDISIPAVDAAARRYPECQWVVANADRMVPYADNSLTRVLSITGRMNSAEFRRVLRDDGRLIVAIASPEDLIEIRGQGRDRVPRTIETFANDFQYFSKHRISTTADLDDTAITDLRAAIYRPMGDVTAGRVTFSLDILVFDRRSSASIGG